MKYSLDLLKKFISINDDIENIVDKFTLKTVEVEEIIQRKIDKKIVIWKIKSVQKHPEADKLNVCMVDCGNKWEYQIICGGTNVAEWIYVPTALPGTYFPKVDMTIEARKMRWIESNGMICSKAELEILEDLDTHWIWDMQKDLDDLSDDDLWKSLVDKYSWLESKIIDVDNKWLTNRPDLTGHFGMAVELNAMYENTQVSFNRVNEYFDNFKNTKIFDILDNKEKTKIWLKSQTDNLNTYILMELDNVSVKNSGFFTRMQIADLWSSPICNWVDFSNLFMNITGQPIHFFDASKVSWNVIIRQAKKWEKFVDLFEKEHELLDTDIVIADDQKILALAGVVWWLDSWVTESTKNILVEIANFDPVCVRKTWVRLGLRTDAELRYEKNINPAYSLYVLILFLDLLKYYQKDLWDYTIWWLSYYSKTKDVNYVQNNIDIDQSKMEKFIFWSNKDWFKTISDSILRWLWFDLNWKTVWIPFWRSPDDINIVEDVYEEVARIYGYENIESKSLQSDVSLPKTYSLVNLIRKMEETFVRNYKFDQVETYPRVGWKNLELFDVNLDNLYNFKNPIDLDKPYMRDNLDYILINYVTKNSKFFDDFKIFDIGRVRSKLWNNNSVWKFADELVGEKLQLSAMYYQKINKNWENDLLLSAKWEIQDLLKNLWLKEDLKYIKTDKKAYHPKKQWNIIYNWEIIWFVWSIHPLVLKENKLSETSDLVYLSLDLQKIDELIQKVEFKPEWYETLQDQIVWRDLCFVVNQDEDFGTILNIAKNIEWISDLDVFDLYKWENLPEWKKSVAFKIKIKGENMQTEYINDIMNKIINELEKTWAKLRN
jgi:phenylalanyl-tRNA synthetase beta chain